MGEVTAHVSVRRVIDGVPIVHLPEHGLSLTDLAELFDDHADMPGRVTMFTVEIVRENPARERRDE